MVNMSSTRVAWLPLLLAVPSIARHVDQGRRLEQGGLASIAGHVDQGRRLEQGSLAGITGQIDQGRLKHILAAASEENHFKLPKVLSAVPEYIKKKYGLKENAQEYNNLARDDNKIRQNTVHIKAEQANNRLYQPQQDWYSMFGPDYGAFQQQHPEGTKGQVHEDHDSARYHKYQDSDNQLQTRSNPNIGGMNHNFDNNGNKFNQDEYRIHERLAHNVHHHGSYGHKQQLYNHVKQGHQNHQTQPIPRTKHENTSLPLFQYHSIASSNPDWLVGSWLSKLWTFNQHGGRLPEVGQNAAMEVSSNHLVVSP